MSDAVSGLIAIGIIGGIAYAIFKAVTAKPKPSPYSPEKLAAIYSEAMSAELPSIRPTSAILKAGEIAYAEANSMLMEAKSGGFVGGSRGVSVHVAKGLTLRAGAFKGHKVEHIVVAARGHLVITSQRIIFAGDQKSFAVPIEKLINITRYRDGFTFNDGSKSHNVMVPNPTERTLFTAMLDRMVHAPA